ncbi:MAG TPA: hypothetical protein VG322_11835 [Candidatus Acidoferrales bacterium]|nr:hypothetical protein [Candidatus Acidoferrales bacterium]
MHARQDNMGDAEIREEVKEALSQSQPELGHSETSIKSRKDLEQMLSVVQEKGNGKQVYFYEMDSQGNALDAPRTSIAAVVHSTGNINRLYSFEGSRQFAAFSEEFNRFISTLEVSIGRRDVLGLAKLFLESSVAGNPGDILTNDLDLRLAVQNCYFNMYRDVWKMLDAYSRWWEQFRVSAPELAPKIGINGSGDYDLDLHTLLTRDGEHPQVQEIKLTISRTGELHVRDIRAVFPDQSRWMFYDFPLPKPETWR